MKHYLLSCLIVLLGGSEAFADTTAKEKGPSLSPNTSSPPAGLSISPPAPVKAVIQGRSLSDKLNLKKKNESGNATGLNFNTPVMKKPSLSNHQPLCNKLPASTRQLGGKSKADASAPYPAVTAQLLIRLTAALGLLVALVPEAQAKTEFTAPIKKASPPPRRKKTTPSPKVSVKADADRDGLDDALEDKLARKWAPELHLPPSSKDWTRPANVDWYLKRVRMRFHNTGSCNKDEQVLDPGKVTQRNIWRQKQRTKDMTWKGCRNSGKLHRSNSSKRFFLQPPKDSVHKGAPSKEWTAYAHVKKSKAVKGGIDIQYWLFYPYNDALGSVNHEGDWERVTVTVVNRRFHSAVLSQHETKTAYRQGNGAIRSSSTAVTPSSGWPTARTPTTTGPASSASPRRRSTT